MSHPLSPNHTSVPAGLPDRFGKTKAQIQDDTGQKLHVEKQGKNYPSINCTDLEIGSFPKFRAT